VLIRCDPARIECTAVRGDASAIEAMALGAPATDVEEEIVSSEKALEHFFETREWPERLG
jgi:hypothetical protein